MRDIEQEIERTIVKDPDMAWRIRVVESVQNKAENYMRFAYKPAGHDPALVNRWLRSIRHLEIWCDLWMADTVEAIRDDRAEARDPYGYRGLSHSDFM